MSCFAVTLMKSRRGAFPSNFQWEINEGGGGRLPPLVRVCVEEEIFDLRGENIANWGNLAVVQRRENIAEILGRHVLLGILPIKLS